MGSVTESCASGDVELFDYGRVWEYIQWSVLRNAVMVGYMRAL